jgi:predicted ATPase/DNA-binding winged helix-turn-helix (wHTH) protein
VALSPKAFDMLHYLVTHAGRLVTKDELLDAIWPQAAVSEAVVRVTIGALRKALGDTIQPPRFIATVPRRGYRFLASVTLVAIETPIPWPDPSATLSPVLPSLLVEREAVLQRLWEAWTYACQGQRQVVWVTGEAGIGKTAVVEAFRSRVAKAPAVLLAAGQCVEHYGSEEAYLPVLEALGHLCRAPDGDSLIALLHQHAPTWLVQMPWLLSAARREQLHYELQGVTRERMLREFAEVVDTVTRETPLVLLLEDLHWSDYATLDLLALLARRRTPACLLMIGTYRPGEALVSHHPLHTVIQDLQRHGYATELPLGPLSVEAVATYLALRFPQSQFPTALTLWLHERTDGNPLFLVTLVQALTEQGVLHEHDGCWTMQGRIQTFAREVPASLRQMLEQQITRLRPEAQRVLEVASADGVEFVTTAVASGAEMDIDLVEERCEELASQQLLRPLGVAPWPSGTVTTRYAFQHALYQQVVYERLGAGRRIRLHQRLGECLEAAYGAQASEVAAELAVHFEQGRDYHRAVQYLQQAGENAIRLCANQEAVRLLTKGLELLTNLQRTPEHTRQELALQATLGRALAATRGFASAEAEQAYVRAWRLSLQVDDTEQLCTVLWGLWRLYNARAASQKAQQLGEQLLHLAQRQHDPAIFLGAHCALGGTLLFRGELRQAQAHASQGMALYDIQRHRALAFLYGEDPGVGCHEYGALALWLLGYPDQALTTMHTALALAQELPHPFSMGHALHGLAYLHGLRRETDAVREQAKAIQALATMQGFPLWGAAGTIWHGWVLAMQDHSEAGIRQLRQGMAAWDATGTQWPSPVYLAWLAEVLGHGGQVDEGLRLLTEALAVMDTTGERWWEAELHRLQGELLLRQAIADVRQAEACLHQALVVARHQQARSWELRAATSLTRLWQQQGKRDDAYELLAPIYGWFTEGFDTADLQAARVLLEELT